MIRLRRPGCGYLIKARVPDVAAYDTLYRRLIDKVPLSDVSATFVMEGDQGDDRTAAGRRVRRGRAGLHKLAS